MNDYIDIGIFAADSEAGKNRPMQTNPLYVKKYKLTAGQHSFTIVVTGKPASVGIDPYMRLIDRNTGDNMKGL